MKKLQLKAFELGADGVLTREQLKNTLGGYMSVGDCPTNECTIGSGDCPNGTCQKVICPKDASFYYLKCVND
jgi:hypothetical protein